MLHFHFICQQVEDGELHTMHVQTENMQLTFSQKPYQTKAP